MPWLTVFIICWIVFFILVKPGMLKRTVLAGILAILLQFSVDYHAVQYGLYKINAPIIEIWNSSVFFVLGPVFTMGILFVQYLPKGDKWLKLANIFIWSSIFLLEELVLINIGVLEYTKWSNFNSFTVNAASFTMLAWVGETFLNPGPEP